MYPAVFAPIPFVNSIDVTSTRRHLESLQSLIEKLWNRRMATGPHVRSFSLLCKSQTGLTTNRVLECVCGYHFHQSRHLLGMVANFVASWTGVMVVFI